MDIDELIELVKQNTFEANNQVIDYLTNNQFDLNSKGKNVRFEMTLLETAIFKKNAEIFDFLLDNGADLLKIGQSKLTPIQQVLFYTGQDSKFLEKILAKLTDKPIAQIFFNENFYYVLFGKSLALENIKILVKHGYELPNNILHIAVFYKNLLLVKYLVEELHFDIETNNSNGYTPLHWAAGRSDEVVQYFLAKGANIYTCNKLGRNILYTLTCSMELLSSDLAIYLLDQNINYDFIADHCDNLKFLEYFLSSVRCYNNQAKIANTRFQIFETLMIKQFFKHHQMFQKVPMEFKKDVEAQIEQILQNRNVHLGIDEYTKKVIILNPSKPISELALKYKLRVCKNSEITESNNKPEQKNELPTGKPSFISTPLHIVSLKELAALAVLNPKLKQEVTNKLWTTKTPFPQELEVFVTAIETLKYLLTGDSAPVIID